MRGSSSICAGRGCWEEVRAVVVNVDQVSRPHAEGDLPAGMARR